MSWLAFATGIVKRGAQIRALLPATANEIAAELGIPSKLVLGNLCDMLTRGYTEEFRPGCVCRNWVKVIGRKREGKSVARIFARIV